MSDQIMSRMSRVSLDVNWLPVRASGDLRNRATISRWLPPVTFTHGVPKILGPPWSSPIPVAEVSGRLSPEPELVLDTFLWSLPHETPAWSAAPDGVILRWAGAKQISPATVSGEGRWVENWPLAIREWRRMRMCDRGREVGVEGRLKGLGHCEGVPGTTCSFPVASNRW